MESLAARPVLVVPRDEWRKVFPQITDLESERIALAEDISHGLETRLEATYDKRVYVDGLGLEMNAFIVDVWDWTSKAADVATLAMLGATLLHYLKGLAARLAATDLDEVAAGKMQPVLGAPLMRLIAAKHAMDDDPDRALRLTDWAVEPLFPQLGDSTSFHAQQLFLATGRGMFDAFIALYNAYGTPRLQVWTDVYETKVLGF